jgi:hypothetical protein
MAVAARPGSSDARVPCPLCGGLIHPIAGKCKHCKADLTTYHAARPAASAPLPALHPAPQANGHAHAHASAPVAYAPAGHAVPVPAAGGASQPVLPPRPPHRDPAAAPGASGWRSWPGLVIIVATIAIVVAVVLMVWPGHNRDEPDGKHSLGPPPAPERMQTAPDIQPPPQVPDRQPAPAAPQAGATPDPWANHTDPLPSAPVASATDLDDDPPDPDALFAPDPGRGPSPPPRRPRLPTNRRGTMMLAMAEHMCRKMLQCSGDDPMVRNTCDTLARRPSVPPAGCPAADRCLQHIDAMTCGDQNDSFLQLNALLAQFSDCADAVRC